MKEILKVLSDKNSLNLQISASNYQELCDIENALGVIIRKISINKNDSLFLNYKHYKE